MEAEREGSGLRRDAAVRAGAQADDGESGYSASLPAAEEGGSLVETEVGHVRFEGDAVADSGQSEVSEDKDGIAESYWGGHSGPSAVGSECIELAAVRWGP